MSEKNFVAYGDAESILTGYANRIKQSPTTFVGTQAQWNALSSSQKAEYTLVDITDDSLSPSGHVDWESNGKLGAKNLCPVCVGTTTLNGVTFTVNSDGTISATGTATEFTAFDIATTDMGYVLEDGNYILSDGLEEHSTDQYSTITIVDQNDVVHYDYANTKDADNDVFSIENSNIKKLYVAICIDDGHTVSNLVFKPMIRLTTDSDETYQPYSMTNKEITPYVQAISNPNLLDNPWFTVNQRGENSYLSTSGIYTLDRWRLYNGQVDINNDGSITLSSTANNTQIQNRVDPLTSKMLDGRTVTLSAIVNGKIYSHTFTWRNSENYQSKVDIGNWVFDFRNIVNDGDSGHLVRFFATTQTSEILVVKAVKLELGTVSTLAMDTIPNYQQELAKCQRYFVRYRQSNTDTIAQGVARDTTKLRFLMPLPVPMRTPPSVTASSTVGDYTNTGLTITRTGTNVTYGDGSVGLIQLNAVSSTSVYTAGEAKNIAVISDNFYIDFSADL